jgi:hypothetical protein
MSCSNCWPNRYALPQATIPPNLVSILSGEGLESRKSGIAAKSAPEVNRDRAGKCNRYYERAALWSMILMFFARSALHYQGKCVEPNSSYMAEVKLCRSFAGRTTLAQLTAIGTRSARCLRPNSCLLLERRSIISSPALTKEP